MEQMKLFSGLEVDRIQELRLLCQRCEYRGSDLVFNEGDRGDALYLIESGQVMVSKKDHHDDEEILGVLEPGEFFGEMALLDRSFRSARVTALEQTVLLVLPSEKLEQFLQHNPRAAMMIYRNYAMHLSGRLRSVSDIFKKIAIESKKLKGEIETIVPGIMSTVTDELRSPVEVIHSVSQVLDDVLMDEIHRKKFLASIREHTDHLASLLDDISRIVQLQQQETSVKKESISVGTIFEKLTTSLQSKAQKKHVMIEIDPKAKSLKIPMHRSHMERAFFHLLDRGIKQNRDGGTLSVSIEQMHEGKRPLVAITFRDEGEGKPSPSSEGFGLALVEHLIRAHGGKVLLKKTKGGSDLTVSLPLD
ncbi:MAG: hypothetical protein A3I05_00960 [Deltaproteobacteria bacterium RIFCSPLOWO2_02_FULL_44_10]|nr:MAG: hypothetical protein A3C46_02020 [Deltaproteobacteria bacterium RIFCSPHIGHO2_02_FULL_44_16]OGQ45816.1 MAG: hypothetical protein A3I05_00960 [Deltaproteobacteria bacterium RIFCSPLOWO2_02_FULL_44_10]